VLNCKNDSFVDFIEKCLQIDPEKRFTPKEALSHQWILDGLPENLQQEHLQQLNTSFYTKEKAGKRN